MKKLALGSVRRLVLLPLVLLLHSAVLLVPVAAHDHAPRGPGAVRLAALSIDSAAVRRGDSGVRVTPAAAVVGDGDVLTVLVDNYNRTGHYEDWVGLWSPSRLEDLDNLALHAPVKYQYCTFGNAAYNVTGQAKLSFRMVNMRADYGIYLFSGSVYNPTLLAVANEAVTMADPDAPTKPRLTLHSPTSVRLLWSSTKTEEPFVTYGPEGASRDSWARVVAETNTYTKEDLCGPPANMTGWRDPGPIHSAVLDGLQPGTAYEYAFGDRSHLSIYYTFRAPPADGAPVNVVVLADHGQQTEDQSREPSKPQITPVATTRWIGEKLDADASLSAVMLIGDISYARGYESEWENYLSQIAPVASRVPWVASLGNHEVDWPDTMAAYPHAVDSGGECAVPALAFMGIPAATFWSVDYGNVHFIYFNTEYDFTELSEQLEWLESDLALVDREKTPWIVFTGHRPMYVDSNDEGSASSDQTVAGELRRFVEPLLLKYNVDLGMYGHHHSAQITCPVVNTTCSSKGIVHVVAGMAGYDLSHNLLPTPRAYTAWVDDQTYGFTGLQTFNRTHLQLRFYENTHGEQYHDLWVIKDAQQSRRMVHSAHGQAGSGRVRIQ